MTETNLNTRLPLSAWKKPLSSLGIKYLVIQLLRLPNGPELSFSWLQFVCVTNSSRLQLLLTVCQWKLYSQLFGVSNNAVALTQEAPLCFAVDLNTSLGKPRDLCGLKLAEGKRFIGESARKILSHPLNLALIRGGQQPEDDD